MDPVSLAVGAGVVAVVAGASQAAETIGAKLGASPVLRHDRDGSTLKALNAVRR